MNLKSDLGMSGNQIYSVTFRPYRYGNERIGSREDDFVREINRFVRDITRFTITESFSTCTILFYSRKSMRREVDPHTKFVSSYFCKGNFFIRVTSEGVRSYTLTDRSPMDRRYRNKGRGAPSEREWVRVRLRPVVVL